MWLVCFDGLVNTSHLEGINVEVMSDGKAFSIDEALDTLNPDQYCTFNFWGVGTKQKYRLASVSCQFKHGMDTLVEKNFNKWCQILNENVLPEEARLMW